MSYNHWQTQSPEASTLGEDSGKNASHQQNDTTSGPILIQKLLDENGALIQTILNHQLAGSWRVKECQVKLHQNLLYLAKLTNTK